MVSAGTFTLGHLGPAVLPELMRLACPGALYALSVNARHYEAAGFEPALAALPAEELTLAEVPIYDGRGEDGHGDDRAFVATFRKR